MSNIRTRPVTFMDCGGYRSIVASRLAIEQGGRTLVVRGATQQPARLLDVIARLEGVGVEAIRGIERSALG